MRAIARLTLISCALTLLPESLQARERETVYAFGYSTNLNDTTQFLTTVQELPGASLSRKEGFLEHRHEYGNQLKAHLESRYEGHETCAMFFGKNRKSVEKKYAKIRARLLKMKHSRLVLLPAEEFLFQPLGKSCPAESTKE